jgi:hypothetical protein
MLAFCLMLQQLFPKLVVSLQVGDHMNFMWASVLKNQKIRDVYLVKTLTFFKKP